MQLLECGCDSTPRVRRAVPAASQRAHGSPPSLLSCCTPGLRGVSTVALARAICGARRGRALRCAVALFTWAGVVAASLPGAPALLAAPDRAHPRRAALALAPGRISALSNAPVADPALYAPPRAQKSFPDAFTELSAILEAYPEPDIVLVQFEPHNKYMYLDQTRSLCVRLRHLGLQYMAYGSSEVACDLLGQPNCVLYNHPGDAKLKGLTWSWSKRYNLLADLAVAGKNALLLDADTAVHINPFPLLQQIEGAKMIVLAEGGLGNGGFNYMPAAKEEDDAVKLLRRCVIEWVKSADGGKPAKMDQDLLGDAVAEYVTGPWAVDTSRTYSSPLKSLGHPPEWGHYHYENMSLEKRDFKSGGSVFRAPQWIVTGGGESTYGWSWHDVPPSTALTHLLGIETAFVPEVQYQGSHVGRVLYAMAFGYVNVPCVGVELTSIATNLVERAANESFAALQTLMRNAYYASLAADTLLIVPKIPCTTAWLKRDDRARYGVHDRRVIVTDNGCYLTAGGWDDCWPSEHVCYPFQLEGAQRSPLMHKHHYSVLREEPIPEGKKFNCIFFGDGKPAVTPLPPGSLLPPASPPVAPPPPTPTPDAALPPASNASDDASSLVEPPPLGAAVPDAASSPPACDASLMASSVKNEFHEVGTKAGTDKVTGHAYHHVYHHFLRWYRHQPVKLLEIGLGCTMNTGSASILMWQSYFDDVDLWMADIDTACAAKVQSTMNNTILIGDQSSEADLLSWVEKSGGSFDYIVDDGSHNALHQLESFRVLFDKALKPGGIYFIEDIESADRKTCEPFTPDTLSRDRFMYWVDELMKFPRNAKVDLPPGLMAITCQREMCAFLKCPSDEPRCP